MHQAPTTESICPSIYTIVCLQNAENFCIFIIQLKKTPTAQYYINQAFYNFLFIISGTFI